MQSVLNASVFKLCLLGDMCLSKLCAALNFGLKNTSLFHVLSLRVFHLAMQDCQCSRPLSFYKGLACLVVWDVRASWQGVVVRVQMRAWCGKASGYSMAGCWVVP
eukprot:scaffold117706_cov16-Tisochrysis_lutea.AAC.2